MVLGFGEWLRALNVNQKHEDYNNTPLLLHVLRTHNRNHMRRWPNVLLKLDADPFLPDRDYNSPVTYCLQSNNTSFLRIITNGMFYQAFVLNLATRIRLIFYVHQDQITSSYFTIK